MSMIDDIKRDHEAGTPGPWDMGSSDGRVLSHWEGIGYWEIANATVTHFRGESGREYFAGGDQEVNARRIARVPDMEAALIAAEELAGCIDHVLSLDKEAGTSSTVHNLAADALAAYRKATGAGQ